MGTLLSAFTRPLQKINIENRVQKVLSKDKPIPSPLYPKEQQLLERAKEENPEFQTEQAIKDISLNERLKQVYVKSDVDQESNLQDARPLPSSRVSVAKPLTGYIIPEVIPPGKCTLDDILNILDLHKADPTQNNVSVLATKFKLSEKTVGSILDYHMLFLYGMSKEVKDKLRKIPPSKKLLV